MLLFSLQTVLLIAAGVALFGLWRATAPRERWLYLAVAAGFLARAVLGQLLFWISWARLPLARSLQLGDGLWVFAQDASWYFAEALRVAGDGVRAIVMYDRGASSVMYEQLLSTFIYLFGVSTAVGVLINLFCYVGTVAILVHWSRRQPRTAKAAALAIVAITFSPAFVLWSLQPLKDPFFQLLFVAFVAACAAWQRAWVAPGQWRTRLGTAVLLVVLLFALAGIRWYFAAVLVLAASLFMLLVVFQSERRVWSFASAIVVAFLLSQSLAVSAAPYLPERLRAILNPRTTLQAIRHAPSSVLASVEATRQGFDHTAASTVIRTGERLKTRTAPAAVPPPSIAKIVVVKETPKPKPATPAPKPPEPKLEPKPAVTTTTTPPPPTPPPVAVAKALTADEEAEVRALLDAQVAAWNHKDIQNYTSWWWQSPEFEFRHGETAVRGFGQTSEYLSKTYGPGTAGPGQVAVSDVVVAGHSGESATATGRWTVTLPDQAPFTGRMEALLRRFPEGWKVARLRLPTTAETEVVAAPPAPRPAALPTPAQPAPVKPVAAKTVVRHTRPAPAKRVAAKPAPPPAPAPAPATPPPPVFTDADAAQVRALLAAQATAWTHNDLARYMATYAAEPELADGPLVVRGQRPVADYFKRSYLREGGALGTLAYSNVSIVGTAGAASITGQCRITAADGDGRSGDFAMQLQRAPEGWRVARLTIPLLHTDERESQTRTMRILAGTAVLIFPRSVGEWLGIFRIGGGRGMLWFTEIDTLVFDLVLLIAVVALAARAPWRNPLTWLVLLITLLIFGPLAYSISNFGTLFRLREMIYVGLLLVPLAVAARREKQADASVQG